MLFKWHCSIHSAEDFFRIKLAIREHVEEGGVPVQEEVLIHNCLRNEVWKNRRKQLTAHTPNESLFVSIGGTITLYPDTDIRAAMLSGKCESPYSVPISATDLSGVVDETDDSDYVDESEEKELGDWDSSNEGEESGSSLAIGEDANGLRLDGTSTALLRTRRPHRLHHSRVNLLA